MASFPPFSTVAGYGGGTIDPSGVAMNSAGGLSSALNVTAAAVIKATAGRLSKVVVLSLPTYGPVTFNDVTTTAGSTTANQVFSINSTAMTVGAIYTLDFPCINGITCSAVGSSGTPVFAVSYF